MFQKVSIVLAFMSFLFAGQAQAMEDEKKPPKLNRLSGKSSSSSPSLDSFEKGKEPNKQRSNKRSSKNFENREQPLESKGANDKDLENFIKKHLDKFPVLFLGEGPQNVSNFIKDFATVDSGVLLRNKDSERRNLKKITDDYHLLINFNNCENSEEIRILEEELLYNINQSQVDFEENGVPIYKEQYKALKALLNELPKNNMAFQIKLPTLEGNKTKEIEGATKLLKNYYDFIYKHFELVVQMKNERYEIVQYFETKYISLPALKNYPILLVKYENKLAERLATDAKNKPPSDSKFSGSSSSPKSSDEGKSLK